MTCAETSAQEGAMRVVCQSDGYLPDVVGGVEVLSARLFGELRRRGHEILVLTSCKSGRLPGRAVVDGISLVRLDFWQALRSNTTDEIARMQREVNALIGDFRPDIMHLNDTQPSSFFFFRRAATQDIPRVLVLHSPIRPAGPGGLQQRLADDADLIVAVSQSAAGDVKRIWPDLDAKLKVILNTLPMPELQPTPLPSAPPLFLFIGRLVKDKGVDVAIAALAGLHTDARMIVIGSGPEKGALVRLVEQYGLGERVEFRGWLLPEDIPGAINLATAVLLPSRWKEPFGLVALQAQQMGRPVIASNVGGLPEIIEDEKSGLLVPADDSVALTAAMRRVTSTPQFAAALGAHARERAERMSDFTRFATTYESVYQDACAARTAAKAMA